MEPLEKQGNGLQKIVLYFNMQEKVVNRHVPKLSDALGQQRDSIRKMLKTMNIIDSESMPQSLFVRSL